MSLSGIKVVEFAGLAPGPFASLILADNGATVIRVDKPDSFSPDVLCRGKRSIAINPKIPSGREALLKLISSADVVIDPFRPGVLERLGLGPEVFLGSANNAGLNPKLIYGRIAGPPEGYGRCATRDSNFDKGLAKPLWEGHDINYIALSGALAMLPGSDKPAFPLNLLADFAGGGMTCVLGILLALIERGKSGCGQVVETDMVSGARYIAAFPLIHSLIPESHLFGNERGKNILDGGAPFYDVYVCKDGRYMSVGCLEPQFFKAFVNGFLQALPKGFNLNGWRPDPQTQGNRDDWNKLRDFMARGFQTNTRDYWAAAFHETDACALPVLTPEEARASSSTGPEQSFPLAHPRIVGSQPSKPPPHDHHLNPGQHTRQVLHELALSEAEIRKLSLDGALGKEAHSSVVSGHKL
ncbi:hypothetical protein DXG01_012750 [Tephrocybe rancida]|nr:hypothetical protein DXG01_012750 [Tephrocybe rancida]